MPIDPVTLGIASSVISGIFGGSAAKKAKRAAKRQAKMLSKKLDFLENNRQAITNPYEGITDLSSMATDRSGQMSNAFSNLSVATKAAEMQIEEADIALANTLDTLMASGAGAGGATALAQAALKSKKNVTASIESQEKSNEDRRAQGEADLERRQMAEKQRIEGIAMSQAEKIQQAEVSGKQFMFSATENREDAKIDRVAGQLDNAQAQMAQASRDGTAAITGAIGGISSAFTAGSSSGN
tara:strand:- start:692 stop:1414 length:723 start_codon:yes stop_codon:yes gene_type:complete